MTNVRQTSTIAQLATLVNSECIAHDQLLLCLESNENVTNVSSQDKDGIQVEVKLKVFLLELVNYKPEIDKYVCNTCLDKVNLIYRFRLKCLQNIAALNEYLQKLLNGSYNKISVEHSHIKQEYQEEREPLNNTETSDENYNSCLPFENIVVKSEPEEEAETTNFTDEQNQKNLPKNVTEEVENHVEDTNKREDNELEFNNLQTSYENLKDVNEEKRIEEDHETSAEVPNASGEIQYKCKECFKQFNTLNLLRRHSRRHTEERPFKCPTCDKTFKLTQHLNTHKRIHTGESPFECDVCHKKFRQLSNLTNHKRIHTGEKPYLCHLCDFKCARTDALKLHLRTHSGEKPYVCDVCHKGFKCVGNLISHKLIHSGEKPYHCHLCDYKSTQSSSVKEHVLTTHTKKKPRKKPYECTFCEFKCKRARYLKQHLTNIHTGDKPNISTFVNIVKNNLVN